MVRRENDCGVGSSQRIEEVMQHEIAWETVRLLAFAYPRYLGG